MADVESVVGELVAGRELSVVDRLAVEAFASLTVALREAESLVSSEGVTSTVYSAGGDVSSEVAHPAVAVVEKCSRELRGWVSARPDLFGHVKAASASGREKFRSGLKAV